MNESFFNKKPELIDFKPSFEKTGDLVKVVPKTEPSLEKYKKTERKITALEGVQNLRDHLGLTEVNPKETDRIAEDLNTQNQIIRNSLTGREIILSKDNLSETKKLENKVLPAREILLPNDDKLTISNEDSHKNYAERASENLKVFLDNQNTNKIDLKTKQFGYTGEVFSREQLRKDLEFAQIGIDFWNDETEKHKNTLVKIEENLALSVEELEEKFGGVITKEGLLSHQENTKKLAEEALLVRDKLELEKRKRILGNLFKG